MKLTINSLIIFILFIHVASLPTSQAALPLGSHCSDLGGDPSSIIPGNQSTAFQASEHYAALISLAQNTTFDTAVSVGAGETAVDSPVYYVSPDGGNGAGTETDPWNPDFANRALQAGDTALFLDGTYDSIIDPKNSGVDGNPITIKAAPGADVHIRALAQRSAIIIRKDYILVEGLTVSRKDYLESPNSFARASNIQVFGDHVTIRNMDVINEGDYICQARKAAETGIAVRGAFNLIENNFIYRMRDGIGLGTDVKGAKFHVVRGNTIADPVYNGIGIGYGQGAPLGHLIEKNIIFGGLVSDGITFDSGSRKGDPKDHTGINSVIVRNNAIFTNAENNIDLKGTMKIVIEGNYLWGALGDNDGSNVLKLDRVNPTSHINDSGGGSNITKGGSTASKHVIIRNNVLMDSNQGTLAGNQYKVYNNTLINNRRNSSQGPNLPTEDLSGRKAKHAGIKGNFTGPDAAILNNIIGDHGYELVVRNSGNARIDGNAYYNTFQSPLFSVLTEIRDWTSLSFDQWQEWLQTSSNFSGNELNSQRVTGGPVDLFVDVPDQPIGDPALMDFSLTSSSPAIDNGVFLTETVGSGSGTTMVVKDAGVFMDGFGITSGDHIQLEGQTQTAKIIAINGDQLIFDQPLNWSAGHGVSLAYQGSRPDVGAIEFSEKSGGDGDGDGIADIDDAFPFDPDESVDTDGDGIGNNADQDDDDDSYSDTEEVTVGTDPLDPDSKPTNPSSPPSLVAHYTFENISGAMIADSSGNRNDAKLWGAALVPGKAGTALEFDGVNDFVEAGTFDVTGEGITMAAWIKVDDFGTHDARIISKSTGIAEQDHYWMLSTIKNKGGHKLRFRLKTNGRTKTLFGTENIPTGQWVHAMAIYDGSNMQLYLDGKPAGSVAKKGLIETNDTVGVRIGDNPVIAAPLGHRAVNPSPGTKNFDGSIDDVRIYNRALSADEIGDIAGNGTPDPEPEPANLIFDNGFEGGSADWGSSGSWRQVPARAMPSNDSREGKKSVRFLPLNNQKRSEFVVRRNKGTFKWGEEYWVGFSIKINEDPTGFRIISQHHAAPHLKDDGSGRSDWSCTAGPNSFTIKTNNGNLDFRTTTHAGYVNTVPDKGSALWGSQAVSKPYQLNKWYDIVLNFKYTTDNSGFMKIWLNGEEVVKKLNTPTVYKYDLCGKPRAPHQYQKIGIYYGTGNQGGEILYDAFRIGNANSSYSQVAPKN